MLQRARKIRVNPTSEQEHFLRQACGVARFAFNWGLAEWKRQYESGGKPSAYALRKQFNAIRREQFPWSYDPSWQKANDFSRWMNAERCLSLKFFFIKNK